jgi:hypothetical protein
MKTINISKQQLIETIANATDDFGDIYKVVYIDIEGFCYSGEVSALDYHIIMRLSGLGSYLDESQRDPGTKNYDSLAVATYIVEEGELIKTSIEYDEDEDVEIKIVDLSDVTIYSTEIIDNCVADEHGYYQPSEISITVNFEVADVNYILDFQTTTTHDYGAYSSKLSAYDGNDDYDLLIENLGEDNAQKVLQTVLEKSNAQFIRNEYVSENYTVSDEAPNGIDANSETNKAVKK